MTKQTDHWHMNIYVSNEMHDALLEIGNLASRPDFQGIQISADAVLSNEQCKMLTLFIVQVIKFAKKMTKEDETVQ